METGSIRNSNEILKEFSHRDSIQKLIPALENDLSIIHPNKLAGW